MPEEEKIPYADFAKKIKEKYPDYKDVDDLILAQKMIEKYPDYKDRVVFDDTTLKKKAEPSTPSPSPSASGISGSVPGASEQSGLNYLAGDTGGVTPEAPLLPIPQDAVPNPITMGEDGVPVWTPPTQQPAAPTQPLQAATTSLETTAKDQTTFDPNLLVEKPSEAMSALTGGVLKAGSLLMQSPTFVWDAIVTPINSLIKSPYIGSDSHIKTWNQLGSADESYWKTMIEELEKESQNMNTQFQKEGDTEISEDFKSGNVMKGLGKTGLMVLNSLPTSAALMWATLANPAAATGLSASAFAADKKRELDKAMPNMSEADKVGWAALSGGAEAGFERLGITKLGPMLAKSLKGVGKEVVEKEAKEIVNQTYGKIIKRYAGVQAEEVLSEGMNTVTQNLIAIADGEDPDRKWNKGVMTSMIVALASAAPMTAPAAALELVVTKQAKKQAQALLDEKTALKADFENPDVPGPVKDIISKKIGDINEKEADLAIAEKEQFESLNEEDQKAVADLSTKAAELEESLNSNIGNLSEETKGLIQKELEDVEKQITEIYKNPKPKTEDKTPETPVQKEATPDKAVATEEKTPEVEKVELPPVRDGGLVRLYEKDKGEWKQNVGGDLVGISPGMKENVQKAYDATKREKPKVEEDFSLNKEELIEVSEGGGNKDDFISSRRVFPKKYDDKNLPNVESDVVKEFINNEENAVEQTVKISDLTPTQRVLSKDAIDEGADGRPFVIKDKEGRLLVVDGHHRIASAALSGKDEMSLDVYDLSEVDYETYESSTKKPFTEGKDLNKIHSATKKKYGEKEATKIISAADRLVNPNQNEVVEIRSNGVVVKEGDKYLLKPFTNTDANNKKWELGKPLDVTEQYTETPSKTSDKPPGEVSGKTPTEPPVTPPPTVPKDGDSPDIFGEKKKHAQTKRMEANDSKYRAVLDEMGDEGKYYTAVKEKKVEAYIKDIVDKAEASGQIETLAKEIIAGKNPFVAEAANAGANSVGDRLRMIAEKEGNEMQKKEMNRVAGILFAQRSKNVKIAATQTAMENIVAKTMPISEEGLKNHFQAVMTESQNTYLTPEQKSDIKTTQESMEELLSTEEGMKKFQEAVEEEVNRVAEATKGKDWVKKVDDGLDDLMIDLKDC